ncbi:hypothetical protein BaRGS_00003852 [Batillaria attramentaria]|uniref:Uncharacterized protein n=1 Tax=Batillaria attramentaria TaxID=370345 RepID=A0ABD0LZD1_9CAEN
MLNRSSQALVSGPRCGRERLAELCPALVTENRFHQTPKCSERIYNGFIYECERHKKPTCSIVLHRPGSTLRLARERLRTSSSSCDRKPLPTNTHGSIHSYKQPQEITC